MMTMSAVHIRSRSYLSTLSPEHRNRSMMCFDEKGHRFDIRQSLPVCHLMTAFVKCQKLNSTFEFMSLKTRWHSSDELPATMCTKTFLNFTNRKQRSGYRSAVSLRPLVTRKIRPLFVEMTKHTIVCVFCRFTFLCWESERKKTFFVAVISVNIWNFVSRCLTTNNERTKKQEMRNDFKIS